MVCLEGLPFIFRRRQNHPKQSPSLRVFVPARRYPEHVSESYFYALSLILIYAIVTTAALLLCCSGGRDDVDEFLDDKCFDARAERALASSAVPKKVTVGPARLGRVAPAPDSDSDSVATATPRLDCDSEESDAATTSPRAVAPTSSPRAGGGAETIGARWDREDRERRRLPPSSPR